MTLDERELASSLLRTSKRFSGNNHYPPGIPPAHPCITIHFEIQLFQRIKFKSLSTIMAGGMLITIVCTVCNRQGAALETTYIDLLSTNL